VSAPSDTRLIAALGLTCLGVCLGIAANNTAAHAEVAKESFIRGTVVNSHTHNPVPGVAVTVRDPVSLDVVGSDTTNADGVYRVTGLTSDEYAIKFNGSARGYETGFLACDHSVVPTYGDACTFGTGREGRALLDRL
jgi:carboxypeptidase family protein